MRSRRNLVIGICLIAFALVVWAGIVILTPVRKVGRRQTVSTWVANGRQTQALASLKANSRRLSGVSPFWYFLDEQGRLRQAQNVNTPLLKTARARGVQVIPTISNEFDATRTAALLTDARLQSEFVGEVGVAVKKHRFDGVDLDFENLRVEDRDRYTAFVRRLRARLAPLGAILTLDIIAKTSEPGTWSGPQALDYAGLAKAADRLNIMAYDEHYSGGEPGPVASIGWVRRVLKFARTKIPDEKLVLGVPLYGYDWSAPGQSESLGYKEAIARARRFNAPIRWDARAGAPWFTYELEGKRHTVWFSDARSVAANLDLRGANKIRGFALFRLGLEDPKVWPAIGRRMSVLH